MDHLNTSLTTTENSNLHFFFSSLVSLFISLYCCGSISSISQPCFCPDQVAVSICLKMEDFPGCQKHFFKWMQKLSESIAHRLTPRKETYFVSHLWFRLFLTSVLCQLLNDKDAVRRVRYLRGPLFPSFPVFMLTWQPAAGSSRVLQSKQHHSSMWNCHKIVSIGFCVHRHGCFSFCVGVN